MKAQLPSYPDEASWQRRSIRFCYETSSFQDVFKKFKGAGAVQAFLKNLRVQQCTPGEASISWLELFVMFHMQGYGDTRQNGNRAITKDTLRSQLKNFKRTTQAIARHTVDDADKCLFLHNNAKMPRLACLGIISHVTMPAFHVEVSKEAQHMIAKEILRSQGRRRWKDLPKILEGRILVQETKLNILGKAAWADNIKRLKDGFFFSRTL